MVVLLITKTLYVVMFFFHLLHICMKVNWVNVIEINVLIGISNCLLEINVLIGMDWLGSVPRIGSGFTATITKITQLLINYE